MLFCCFVSLRALSFVLNIFFRERTHAAWQRRIRRGRAVPPHPEPREGCGGGATALEREMFVYPTRVFQMIKCLG